MTEKKTESVSRRKFLGTAATLGAAAVAGWGAAGILASRPPTTEVGQTLTETVTASSASTASGEAVNIGCLVALSGEMSVFGQRQAVATGMAEQEVNAAGGVLGGRPIKVIIEDTQSTPSAGVEAVHKLIDVDHVVLVSGCWDSSTTIPTGTYSQQKHVPQIAIGATSPDLRTLGKGGYFYSLMAEDTLMSAAAVKFAAEDGPLGTVGVYVMNDPYGLGIERGVKQAIQQLGGKVGPVVEYESGKTDYRMELGRLFAEPIDTVFEVSWGSDALISFQEMHQLGYYDKVKGRIYCAYMSDTFLFIKDSKQQTLVEGLKGLDPAGLATLRGKKFQDRLGKLHPEMVPIDSATMTAYDAIWFGAIATDLANSLSADPEKINAALPLAFEKLYGTSWPDRRVDENGMQITEGFMKEIVENGALKNLGVIEGSTETTTT